MTPIRACLLICAHGADPCLPDPRARDQPGAPMIRSTSSIPEPPFVEIDARTEERFFHESVRWNGIGAVV